MKLVIDRKRWQRGKSADGSYLICKNSCMCCLGFLGEVCGVDQGNMLERCYPIAMNLNLPTSDARWPKWLFRPVRGTAMYVDRELACINDDENLSDAEREEKLRQKFLEYGDVEVEFVG